MRGIMWLFVPVFILIVIAQGYFSMQCYEGNDRACFMISKKHDVTFHQR